MMSQLSGVQWSFILVGTILSQWKPLEENPILLHLLLLLMTLTFSDALKFQTGPALSAP